MQTHTKVTLKVSNSKPKAVSPKFRLELFRLMKDVKGKAILTKPRTKPVSADFSSAGPAFKALEMHLIVFVYSTLS